MVWTNTMAASVLSSLVSAVRRQ